MFMSRLLWKFIVVVLIGLTEHLKSLLAQSCMWMEFPGTLLLMYN